MRFQGYPALDIAQAHQATYLVASYSRARDRPCDVIWDSVRKLDRSRAKNVFSRKLLSASYARSLEEQSYRRPSDTSKQSASKSTAHRNPADKQVPATAHRRVLASEGTQHIGRETIHVVAETSRKRSGMGFGDSLDRATASLR